MELILATVAGQNKDILSQNKYFNALKNQLSTGSSMIYWHQGGISSFYKKLINELAQMNLAWVKENHSTLDSIDFLDKLLKSLFSAGGISSRTQKDGILIEAVAQKRK
jgi:hypothetical protein